MLKNLLSAAVEIGALRVKSLFNICLPDCFVVIFLLSAYFFKIMLFEKTISGIPLECQTNRILIRKLQDITACNSGSYVMT